MNQRDLTSQESEKVKILEESNINYALLFLTETGLEKSILDATKLIVQLLKHELVHDFELQPQGSEHKVTLPCILITNKEYVETKISLYRPMLRMVIHGFGQEDLITMRLPTKFLLCL